MKQEQKDVNFLSHIASTALTNCPRYEIEMNQYPQSRVHHIPVCVLSRNAGPARASEGACPTSPPRNISHSVCRPLEKAVAGVRAEPTKA